MFDKATLKLAREIRLAEKARYIAANSARFPDVIDRWKRYEKLILDKYTPEEPPLPLDHRRHSRFRRGLYRLARHKTSLSYAQTLDIAWVWRDRHHERRAN